MDMAARRYDAWRTAEPPWFDGPDETWQMQHHCSVCGCWLKLKADRTEDWEDGIECDGTIDPEYGVAMCDWYSKPHEPHMAVQAAGVHEYRTCSNCGVENKVTEM